MRETPTSTVLPVILGTPPALDDDAGAAPADGVVRDGGVGTIKLDPGLARLYRVATDSGRERSERLTRLPWVESDFDPLPLDADAARAFGAVTESHRNRGGKTHARTHDAMIAAIALANGLPLYTCNPQDFEGIDGLEVVAVELPR